MCFDHDSAPPIPPIAGAAVDHADLVLQSADGTEFAAFLAMPPEPPTVGVVVLPDVRGLYRFYEEVALRLAERGFAAIAIDYFGRTAGVAKRGEDFDFMPQIAQTTTAQIQADVAAAVAHLRAKGAQSVFTIGFCFGGRHAWLSASEVEGLAGVIGFYGMPGASPIGEGPSPMERAGAVKAPLLGLMGGADDHIGPEVVAAYDRALQDAGAEHEIVSYPGAPHSFFDRKHEEFAAESADAWERVLAFLQRYARSL
ncbi:MAG: dienelactone hydrolase family protein [Solirubrobacterales bacterium]|nr:dienelactone hydrolase family protein [Solirubrobacterales bacterium]